MKQGLLLFSLVVFAIFFGSVLGQWATNLPEVGWFGELHEIGFSTFELDLELVTITLGAKVKVCLAQGVLLLAAICAYPKLCKVLFG